MLVRDTILCLGGWGFSKSIFNPLAAILEDTFNCMIEDLVGFTNDRQSWAKELMDRMPASFHVLGWSLGGTLGLWLKKKYPHRIREVFVLSGTPYFPEEKNWPGVSKSRLEDIKKSCHEDSDSFLKQFLRWQISLRNKEAVAALKASLLSSKNHKALRQGLEELCSLDCRDNLDQAHYFLGENDNIIPAVALSSKLRAKLVPNADHAVLLTHPHRILDWMEGVLYD